VNEERNPRLRTQAEEKLLQALKARLEQDGRSISEIERAVGAGHGTLANVLRGRSELRLHHLEILGSALYFTVPEVVAEAYGLRSEYAELRRLVAETIRAELKRISEEG
jgi:transcriptional regulator with XRE-family HTH domain